MFVNVIISGIFWCTCVNVPCFIESTGNVCFTSSDIKVILVLVSWSSVLMLSLTQQSLYFPVDYTKVCHIGNPKTLLMETLKKSHSAMRTQCEFTFTLNRTGKCQASMPRDTIFSYVCKNGKFVNEFQICVLLNLM
jgi:hypothetical protein